MQDVQAYLLIHRNIQGAVTLLLKAVRGILFAFLDTFTGLIKKKVGKKIVIFIILLLGLYYLYQHLCNTQKNV